MKLRDYRIVPMGDISFDRQDCLGCRQRIVDSHAAVGIEFRIVGDQYLAWAVYFCGEGCANCYLRSRMRDAEIDGLAAVGIRLTRVVRDLALMQPDLRRIDLGTMADDVAKIASQAEALQEQVRAMIGQSPAAHAASFFARERLQ